MESLENEIPTIQPLGRVRFTVQDNTTINGKIITAEKLVAKAQYIFSTQVDTNWYWNKHPQQHFITVPTRTTLHPRIEVNVETDFHAIPKILYNITKAKKPYQDSLYV